MMKQCLRGALVTSAVVWSVGCVSYPIVKQEAFSPKPKVAIVSYQSEAVANGTLGLPIKVDGIDAPYQVFSKALADAQFEVVPAESVRSCQQYFKLPKPLIDIGTTAKGLERVQVTKDNAAGLAKCVGADVVVSVYSVPEVVAGFQVAGVGTSKVQMKTAVHAWDNAGQEIWLDRLTVQSDGFKVAGSVMDPREVDAAGVQALTDASKQAVSRFTQKLGAAPAQTATATQ